MTAPRGIWRGIPRDPQRWLPVLVGLLAFLPRALTAGSFQTIDEVPWMRRSLDFSDALLDGQPALASAATEDVATMPGITTMWLGTLARIGWWLGGEPGAGGGAGFLRSLEAIHLSQLAVAVATAVLITLVVALAWRWTGPVVALTAGVVLASEPFMVAHGSVLHTDELAALFGAAGVLALLYALGLPDSMRVRSRALAALAGALLAGAFLSKLSALALAPGLALVVGALILVAAPRRPILTALGVAAAAAVATILVAWPALWADPANQIELIGESARLAQTEHPTFFRGEITSTPGVLYYAFVTPLRMTPWFLIGAIVLVPVALLARRWRRHALILTIVIAPAIVVLSVASKQFDRYVLIVLPHLALLVGMGLDVVVDAIRQRLGAGRGHRWLMGAAAGAVIAVVAHAALVAPWGLAYFNPLLGGSERAESTTLVGWGEGLELAGEQIREREAPACDLNIAVFTGTYGYAAIESAFPCGQMVGGVDDADYLAIYVNGRQRASPRELDRLRAMGALVDVARIRRIDYVELYDLRAGPRTDAQSGALGHG